MNFDWLANLWCRIMHPVPMWPIHGYYMCPACRRQYPVPWETERSRSYPLGEAQPALSGQA